MSGGVDSSVAASLLKDEGYEVIGVTMRLWSEEDSNAAPLSKRCCSVEDVQDARRVCDAIGARHYFVNFEKEFQKHVVDYFVAEYQRGRTPHPCLACNDKMKFDFLLRRANFMDADYIATGHYARIRQDADGYSLLKGVDSGKDQSYVLFTLTQTELARLLLPVGDYPKARIRELAYEAGLAVADKPDSQEICFIPDGDYRKFVGDRAKPKPGNLVDQSGNVLGDHAGIQFFTVGQRRKLGLQGNSGEPLFVTKINALNNQVTLGAHEDLMQRQLWASKVNFLDGTPPVGPTEVTAKIRYRANDSAATLIPNAENSDGWVEIMFDEPQRAVTPGQAVVFYQGDKVLGGGIIEIEAPEPEVELSAATANSEV
jgi:tRNA-specific 2-thiouridylase